MLIAILFVCARVGKSDPPGLSIRLGTNVATLTVTNSAPGIAYEIYSNGTLMVGNWGLLATGAVSVTNFSVATIPAELNFFKARAGNDDDGDNVPNYQDANPRDTNFGLLNITILFPTNRAVLQ